MATLYPVIMCGGSGTRLWPVSHPKLPKQFVDLIGGGTLFERTVERVAGLDQIGQCIIVTNRDHARFAQEQLPPGLNAVILLEPEPRDSAPAMAAAAAHVAKTDPDGVCIFLASDHFIPDAQAFRDAVTATLPAASEGRIVTLGIRPTYPATCYGYIKPMSAGAPGTVAPVSAFVEKPDEATATQYLTEGYVWNSGNFICTARTLIDELTQFAPDVIAPVRDALDSATVEDGAVMLSPAFRTARKISIDYAVMEPTEKTSVLGVDFDWSDLGTWDSIAAITPRDDAGNGHSGDVILHDAANCLVRADAPFVVAATGVSDLVIVASENAVLVSPLDKVDSVKAMVNALPKRFVQRTAETPPNATSLAGWAARYRRWLFSAALPLWATNGKDWAGWGFHEGLSHDSAPAALPRRARVQARQIYSFAVANTLGWTGPWESLIRTGLADFEAHYQRKDGFFATLVAPDGTVLDDTAVTYDQAFAILAYAKADPIIGGCEEKALALLGRLEQHMSLPAGGFIEAQPQAYQSNPHMHLLEACMEWMAISDDPRWGATADKIVTLATDHFIDAKGGFIREFFDEHWAPAPSDAGEVVEPGHQFEWAWLLERYALLQNRADLHAVTDTLFACGLKGICPERQFAVMTLDPALEKVTDLARLWTQAEYLKAAILLAQRDGAPSAMREHAKASCEAFWAFCDHPVTGLYYDKNRADGTFDEEPVTASSLYHIISAIEQILAAS